MTYAKIKLLNGTSIEEFELDFYKSVKSKLKAQKNSDKFADPTMNSAEKYMVALYKKTILSAFDEIEKEFDRQTHKKSQETI